MPMSCIGHMGSGYGCRTSHRACLLTIMYINNLQQICWVTESTKHDAPSPRDVFDRSYTKSSQETSPYDFAAGQFFRGGTQRRGEWITAVCSFHTSLDQVMQSFVLALHETCILLCYMNMDVCPVPLRSSSLFTAQIQTLTTPIRLSHNY
jgi:hypothetical protein